MTEAAEVKFRELYQKDNGPLATMIRQVFEEFDAPRTGTVYSDPTTDDLFTLFNRKDAILWVAEFAGRAKGCCGVFPTSGLLEGVAELVKFYLDPSLRGRGVGHSLMQKSIDSAYNLGYSALYLESLPHFATAIKMYERLGFRKLRGPMLKSEHSSCNIWMLKEL